MSRQRTKVEKIALSPNARELMKTISKGIDVSELVNNETMSQTALSVAAEELQAKGLADCYSEEEIGVVEVVLTDYGKAYLQGNPKIRNPINTTSWWWILMVAVVSATIGSIVGAVTMWIIG